MMLVDCQTCPVRDVHCADCMVTALHATPFRPTVRPTGPERLDLAATAPTAPTMSTTPLAPPAPGTAPLDRAERRAVSAFLAAGLVTTTTANAARAELDQEVGARAQLHRRRWAV